MLSLEAVGYRLEQYTLQNPQEVLRVEIEVNGESDQVMIYKGVSSSLMRSTAFDPDIAMIPEDSKIIGIDRLQSPYNPDQPMYIQQGLVWEEFELLLS